MNENRTQKSFKNILWGMVRQVIILILSFSTRTIFIRKLGAEYVGVGGLYSNILTVLSLTEFGISNVFLFGLYKPLKEKNIEEIKGLILFYKKIYRIIVAVLCSLGVAMIPLLKYILNTSLPINQLILYYLLYLLNSICSYVAVYKSILIQADQKIYIKNVIQTICIILQYSLQISVLFLTKSYALYLVIQIICTLSLNLIMGIITNKKYPFLRDSTIRIAPIQKEIITKNTFAMFLYKIANVLVNNTDNILISILLGTAVVGYYSNYFAILTYLNLFINILVVGINASLGNLNAENNPDHSFETFERLLFVFNMFAGLFASCYFNLIQDFIPIWIGEEYLLKKGFVLILLCYFYITTVESPIWMFRETMGLYNQVKWIMIVAAMLNIILSLFFGKMMGLNGIILATSLSRLLVVSTSEPRILYNKFNRKVWHYYKKQSFYFIVNIISFIFSTIISYGVSIIINNEILTMLLKLICCISCCLMGYFITCRKKKEFCWIRKMLKRRKQS